MAMIDDNQINTPQNIINRRQFIGSLIAAGLAPGLLTQTVFASEKSKREFWVSAQGKNQNSYGLSWTTSQKSPQTQLSGFRGHGVSQHPLRQSNVIMFGRRPSQQLIEVNLVTGQVEAAVDCQADRHLFGHGCFSADGKKLFTTEADLKTGQGKIVVRDSNTYQPITEYDSYGIGPHEIKLMSDQITLVVANGGIHTRPETGRKKLNLVSMFSTLTYIDSRTGKLLEAISVEEPKSSIRHLDVAQDGSVAIAIQLQRKAAGHNNIVALTGVHQRGKSIRLFDAPETLLAKMNDYVGSVAINNQTRIAGFACPKGNLVAFWDMDKGNLVGYHAFNDACGVAVTADQKHFVTSSSVGQLRFIHADSLIEDRDRRITNQNVQWDNHLASVMI